MEGHVNITLLSLSRYNGDSDLLTFSGNGLLKRTQNGWHLRYTAGAPDGSRMASDIRLENGIAIIRNITGNYSLTLDPQEDTQSRIPTSAGTLTMAVHTRTLDWQLDTAPGRIIMSYTLMSLGQTLSDLHLTIHLRDK